MQVIEAAIENVKLKQQIFADLEKACGPQTILSTNTSTIDISLACPDSLWPHAHLSVSRSLQLAACCTYCCPQQTHNRQESPT